MAGNVPYKAYQSKRHSRNLSNNFTPPQSPPLPPIGSPSKPPRSPPTNTSLKRLSVPGPPVEVSVVEKIEVSPQPSQKDESIRPPPSPSPAVAQIAIHEVPPSPISEPATAPISPQVVDEPSKPQPTNGIDRPKTPEVVTPPAVSTPAPALVTSTKGDDPPASPTPVSRPRYLSSSTFRHVPARASPLRPSASVLTSSQRGLNTNLHQSHSHLVLGAQSRSPSAASVSSATRPVSMFNQPSSKMLDFGSGVGKPPSSPISNGDMNSSRSTPVTPRSATPLSVPSKPTTPSNSQPVDYIAPPVPPKSATPSPMASPSRPSSAIARFEPTPSETSPSTTQVPPSRAIGRTTSTAGNAPYRHGFQPKGVYVQRTDEFLEARRLKRGVAKIEDRRLERRLEKLIDLHFSSSSKPSTPIANMPEKPAQPRRQSSFFDFDLSELKGKNASDLWRGVLDSAASTRLGGVNAKGEIRQQEMAITPWQEDSSVPACPLCLASFNALTNRKHHCRLCGRVVCSLPIKPPTRNELCSFLFFVDSKTGGIEELSGDMIDYGVKRKDIGIAKGDAAFVKKLAEEQEKYLKGPFNKKLGIVIGYINVSLLSAKKNYSEAHQQTVTQPVIRLSDEDTVVLTSTKSIAVRLQKILVSMRIAEEHLADAISQVPSVVVTELRNLRRVTSSIHITAKQCRERESWLSYFNMSPTTDSPTYPFPKEVTALIENFDNGTSMLLALHRWVRRFALHFQSVSHTLREPGLMNTLGTSTMKELDEQHLLRHSYISLMENDWKVASTGSTFVVVVELTKLSVSSFLT
ncbi:carboxypeptidase Y-deficient [Serendipita sp. 405]|nr:carboxypeptidase Y-deficient [Serendipita sp. 405]